MALNGPDQSVPEHVLAELEPAAGAQGPVVAQGVNVVAGDAGAPEEVQADNLVQARPAAHVRVETRCVSTVPQKLLQPAGDPVQERFPLPGMRKLAQGRPAPRRRRTWPGMTGARRARRGHA